MFSEECAFEYFIKDLRTYVKDNINTYITEVNAAYPDDLIKNIPAAEGAYAFYQQLTDKPNFDQYVIIDVGTDLEVISNRRGDGAVTVQAMILVVRSGGANINEYYKNLRYMEAVRLLMVGYDNDSLDGDIGLSRIFPHQVAVGKDGTLVDSIAVGVEMVYTLA